MTEPTLGGHDAAAEAPAPPEPGDDNYVTDVHLAARFAGEELTGRYLWTAGLGWMASRPGRWQQVDDTEPAELARDWLHRKFREDISAPGLSAEQIRTRTKQWLPALSAAHVAGVTRLARGIARAEAGDFDRHPDLLNCPNGVLHLPSGELRPYDPALLLTRCTGVRYVAGARHPDWEKALEALPEDVRDWFQVRCGQAFTGYMPPDDTIVILQGDGENGKTTIMQGLKGAAGDFYAVAGHKVLFGDPGQHDTVFMPFRGARIAVVEETPEEGRLNSQAVKRLTTPQMTGHFMRQDETHWDTTHSLFVCTNPLPEVESTDLATWRRMPMLSFPFTFLKPGTPVKNQARERTGDPDLRQRIIDGRDGQHEAVLAWAAEGARRWYAMRRTQSMLPMPDRMLATIAAWQATANRVFGFAEEYLTQSGDHYAMADELYRTFCKYLEDGHRHPWSPQKFSERFTAFCRTQRWDVVRRKVKHTTDNAARLSRPADCGYVPPKSYWIWDGVRFKGRDDGVPPVDLLADLD